MTDDPTVPVAVDLREIVRLHAMLPEQAEHRADDKEMPGGLATAALGPVADPEAWQHRFDTAERLGLPTDHVEDEDEWETPLQTLLFWTQRLKDLNDTVTDLPPSVETEADWLSRNLQWVRDNEPRWGTLAEQVHGARVRLENMLQDGERLQSGAPCLYCRTLLVRVEDKKTGGLTEDWRCPTCRREYGAEQYQNAVKAAAASLEIEALDDASMWATIARAASEAKRSPRTVKHWIREGLVRRACLILGRREVVSLDDVLHHSDTRRRRRDAA